MTKLGILARPDSWYFQDLSRAAASNPRVDGCVGLSFGSLSALIGDTEQVRSAECDDLSQLAGVIVRTMPPGTLEQVVFRMNALHRLESVGMRVINRARSLEVAVDKYLALARLGSAGLPVPTTNTAQDWRQAMNDFHALGGDVVVKPLFGSEGRGITRICDEASAWRVFKTLDQFGHVIHQQEFINHQGWDLRVLKIGDRYFGMRRSNPIDFRTNVSQGAKTSPMEPTAEHCGLADRAAEAVGAEIAGVDILPDIDGRPYVLEINAVPGWKALARTLNVDVARLVVDYATS